METSEFLKNEKPMLSGKAFIHSLAVKGDHDGILGFVNDGFSGQFSSVDEAVSQINEGTHAVAANGMDGARLMYKENVLFVLFVSDGIVDASVCNAFAKRHPNLEFRLLVSGEDHFFAGYTGKFPMDEIVFEESVGSEFSEDVMFSMEGKHSEGVPNLFKLYMMLSFTKRLHADGD